MPRLQKYEAFAVHLALHFTIPSGFHQVNYVCWHVHVCAGCGKIQRDLVRTVQECCSIIRRALFEAFWSCFRVHWCRRTAGTQKYSEFRPLISFFILFFNNATLKLFSRNWSPNLTYEQLQRSSSWETRRRSTSWSGATRKISRGSSIHTARRNDRWPLRLSA